MVDRFKKSQDFIDICYMIDHVEDISARLDVLHKLGYKIGISIIKNEDDTVKKVNLAKNKKDLRIQVTPKIDNINYAKCVVLEIK